VKKKVHLPPVVNMDDIANLQDEELGQYIHQLDVERTKLISMSVNPKAWDVELAYALREAQMRAVRPSAHDRYLKQQENELNQAYYDEQQLPVADLDNSSYTSLFFYN